MDVESVLEEIKLPDIYYFPEKNWYFWQNGDRWQQSTAADTLLRIKNIRYCGVIQKGESINQAQRILLRLQEEKALRKVISVGWEEPEVKIINGERTLVMDGCKLLEPKKGNWDTIRTFTNNLQGEQIDYYKSWQCVAEKGLSGLEKRRPGQALILTGPSGIGKSLLQNRIITPLLGGKYAKPFGWLIGETDFNSELFEACHMLVEDEFHLADIKSRTVFGAALKKLTANQEQRVHRKGFPAYSINTYWRTTISLNDEPHHIAVLPELDPSLEDKLMILQCETHPLPLPSGTPIESAFERELPAFLYHLLYEYEIPPALRDERFGVKAFVHPNVKADLDDIDAKQTVAEVLDTLYGGKGPQEKRITEILVDISTYNFPHQLVKQLYSLHSMKSSLRKLSRDPEYCDKVQYHRSAKRRWWTLNF
jgi:hypothetical protein